MQEEIETNYKSLFFLFKQKKKVTPPEGNLQKRIKRGWLV